MDILSVLLKIKLKNPSTILLDTWVEQLFVAGLC
jgi:hypothetical protein